LSRYPTIGIWERGRGAENGMTRQEWTASSTANCGATVGYEAQLCQMAQALYGSMDATGYKHVVLRLIYLKHISDTFEDQHSRFMTDRAQGTDPADPNERRALNIFWLPPEARSKDALGRVYEYFLSQFASARGKKAGERRLFGALQREEQAGSTARRPAPTRVTAVAFTEG